MYSISEAHFGSVWYSNNLIFAVNEQKFPSNFGWYSTIAFFYLNTRYTKLGLSYTVITSRHQSHLPSSRKQMEASAITIRLTLNRNFSQRAWEHNLSAINTARGKYLRFLKTTIQVYPLHISSVFTTPSNARWLNGSGWHCWCVLVHSAGRCQHTAERGRTTSTEEKEEEESASDSL